MADYPTLLVNNTCQILRDFEQVLLAVPECGTLPEELVDIFTVRVLPGRSAEGHTYSRTVVVEMA